ncbi:condensation domain-containing protein [Amycolatopsis sp.]|uniref:condensation domain-containing protein n=1 Tax=Amycolatopsis sp. TaxID=37632 RepID=UPI002D7E4FBB|nr:condensation domain-containing protein [Amycolatopsis sp.]HET6706546.1 condensation domain-containing protein [Amycolatopsis sp.]
MTISDGPVARAPLSANQEFLCGFDLGDADGPFGPRFHIVHGWRLRGEVDVDALRGALVDVVERHEALRTLIVRDEPERYQKILPAGQPHLEVRELGPADADRDRRVEELIIEVESGEIHPEPPLVRAVLGRFDDKDSVLVLIVHHTAADGWSVRLVIRDLATRYAARRGLDVGELPEPRQYREFAEWQAENVAGPELDRSRGFWRKTLDGARVYSVPTDLPKSAGIPESSGVYRFQIGAELVKPALELASAMRATPFMVLLAAFEVLVLRTTGETDVTVPTFTPGRGHEQFQLTVGPFFNYLPLRTDLAGVTTFREVATRVRRSCLQAYSHDIPFGQIVAQAPEMMERTLEDRRAAVVFQVFPFPFLLDGELVGDLEFSEVRRRLLSQPVGSDVPNGALWTLNLDPAGDIVAGIQYNTNLFAESSVAAMVEQFVQVLGETVTRPDAPL